MGQKEGSGKFKKTESSGFGELMFATDFRSSIIFPVLLTPELLKETLKTPALNPDF